MAHKPVWAEKVTKAEWEATRVHDPNRGYVEEDPWLAVIPPAKPCDQCGQPIKRGQPWRDYHGKPLHQPCPPT